MGVAGHIGIAFDPADEALAIAVVNGEGPDGDEWVRYHTDYGLFGENCWAVHRVLHHLAAADPSVAAITPIVFGTHEIGEGPAHPMCLYRADELGRMAAALARVDDAALIAAMWAARVEIEANSGFFAGGIADTFDQIRREVSKVAANGWAMIGFMC